MKTLERIGEFLRTQHVMTLAVCTPEGPHCASIFYAYDPVRNRLVFATDPKTEHGAAMAADPLISAAVHLQTETVGKIRGVQIRGDVVLADEADRAVYFRRFPYARAMMPTLWRLCPQRMKFTDNRLGIGKKLLWEAAKDETSV